MAGVKLDEIVIPIFDGTDYKTWKIRILKYLEMKKCKEVVTRAKLEGDKMETWKEADIKATNYIYSAISNKQLEYVINLESAYQILKKFDELYMKESTALQIVRRSNMEAIKLKDYKDVKIFFEEFEKAINDLKAAGAVVDEQEKLRYMIKALPREYSHIGDLIDVLPKTERTVEYLKSKIELKAVEEQSTLEENKETVAQTNVFTTESKGKCYTCGKVGHYQKDCWHNNTSQRGRGGHHRGWTVPQGNYRGNYQKSYRGRRNYRGAANTSVNNGIQQRGKWTSGDSFITQVNTVQREDAHKVSENKIHWILDSGCTDHIVNKDNYFESFVTLKEPIEVKLGDGRILEATKVGKIKTMFKVKNSEREIRLFNVFYVKDMRQNLISYSRVTEKNKIVSQGNVSEILNMKNELIAIAIKQNNLYHMISYIKDSRETNSRVLSNNNNTVITKKEKWHRILGHVNFKYLNTLCKNELLEGLPKRIEDDYMKCAICTKNKMHNVPFKKNRKQTKDILEIVHTDLNGPHKTLGNHGEKYFLTFIDDYSKIAKVYSIKTKAEVSNCLIEYVNLVENKTGKKIKVLRCDNGKEYINSRIFQFAREKGIMISPCPPYVHELNGVAERYNRSIMDTARCLLEEARVSKRYWPEIVKAAAYLKNRTLANTIERKTPYEIFFNEKPNVEHLKLYGSRVFVRIPEQIRNSKWESKAKLGILLGYTDMGYRVLVNNRIIEARHIDIVEKNVKYIGFEDIEDVGDNENETNSIESSDSEEMEEGKESVTIKETEQSINNPLRRSARERHPNSRLYNNDFITQYVYVNYTNAMVPKNFEEAIESSENNNWVKAMKNEMDSLKEHMTWKLVEKPEGKRIIDVKWIFTKKDEETYKARLVARGYQQEEHVDHTYSPIIKIQTLKTLLAFCCQKEYRIEQMDVQTAFLNGKLKSEVYVKQPVGFEDGTNRVYKLYKSLYGLRESPRLWYECFNKYMVKLGFKRTKYDYCLYVKCKKSEYIYILLFVDDILICSKNRQDIKEVKSGLLKRFKMKDMGTIKTFIGIDIDYNFEVNEMTLSQKKYIESLAAKYRLDRAKLYNTPIETQLRLEPAKRTDPEIKYRNLIGELLYISSGTRPDIAFSVNYLSRFQNCYDKTHYKYALRILKYLYLTRNLKLTYNKNEKAEILDCLVDADWAGDIMDRRSTSGYIIRLFGNIVYWKSRKQGSVTKSSTFAEYVALSEAVTNVNCMVDMLEEAFNLKVNKPVKIYEDNAGAVIIAKHGNLSKNSKHIEIQYHFINENYENGNIDVVKINSDNNIADICTKALSKTKFVRLRELLKLKE